MYECNKAAFGQIIGRSRSYVDLLDKIGVIESDYFGRVIMYASFRNYYCDYLFHLGTEGRNLEIANTLQRLKKLKVKKGRRKSGLEKARSLLPLIYNAEFKLDVLKKLKRLGVSFSAAVIKSAEKEVQNLREEIKAAKMEIRGKILEQKIKPVQCETILLARYVDCESWQEIEAGYSYSLSHIYKLHRQGKLQLKNGF